MRTPRLRRAPAAALAIVLVTALLACDNSKSTTAPPVPASIAIVRGAGDSLTVGSAAVDSLTVRVTSAASAPVGNVQVTWTLSQGDGALSQTVSTTNANGEATVVYAPGSVAQAVIIAAKVAAIDPLNFTITQTPAAPEDIAETPNDTVTAVLNGGPVNLQVRVIDEFGNAVAGAPVTWNVTGGDGSDTFALTVTTTDQNGVATAQFTPSGTPGDRTITAAVSQTLSLAFDLTVMPAPDAVRGHAP